MEKHLKEAIQILDFHAHPELCGIGVYLLNVDYLPKEVLAYLASTLSLREKRKAVRFRFERHRNVYIAGRGLLRVLIGECLDLFPGEIEIEEGRYGKPYLKGYQEDFEFNVSNSKNMVAIAVNPAGQPIGVDLEKIDKHYEYWEIAAHYFTTEECNQIFNHRDFYKCWTKKEALLKVTGVGLVEGLNNLNMADEINFVEVKDERLLDFKNKKYTLYTLGNDDIVLSLAVGGKLAKLAQFSDGHPDAAAVTNVYLF